MTEQQETKWISGVWRRIGALVVDMVLLGMVGYVLGLAFWELLVDLGSWGRLLGFVIALLYFGLMNSSFANGQTLGKRLLGIRVVDAENNTIGLPRSFARYAVLGLPFFLNGIHIGAAALSYLIIPLSVVLFGGALSILYLFVFNRVTRQSLHDLAVGSYVVHADAQKQAVGPVWKVHYVVVAVLFLSAALVPTYAMKLTDDSPFKEMLAIHEALVKNPLVRFANVTVGSTVQHTTSGDSTTTNHVTVEVFVTEDVLDDAALAREIALQVMAVYPEAMNNDSVQISLRYGYDIGIWSSWRSQFYTYAPQELGADV